MPRRNAHATAHGHGAGRTIEVTALGPLAPDLTVRCREAELMDDPRLDVDRHRRALAALARVNRVSLAAERVWREVRVAAEHTAGPVRVLDVACGGGDVLRDLARRARARGVDVELHGCDVSAVALQVAAEGLAEVGWDPGRQRLFQLDVLEDPLPAGYDVVTTALFLHHLGRHDAVRLLRTLRRATHGRVLAQDLRRTRLGYAFAWVGLHALTTSDVARVDGLRSVRAAFTVDEAHSLASEAGLEGATVERVWPQRFVLRWVAA